MPSIKKQGGFTILELLTVIAIIGILAALIFPVASSARRKAKETQCINNMMQVFSAVKQFQLDERRYPEFIAGPAMPDGGGNTIPLEKSTGMVDGRAYSIFPEYINSINGLRCPSASVAGEPTTSETVPDPMFDLGLRAFSSGGNQSRYYLYAYSSYDCQMPVGSSNWEAHYSLARMDMTASGAMNDPDKENQLRWRNPPSDTVITWCSYHRGGDGNDPGAKDLVLFLDGHVARIASTTMVDWTNAWRVKPNL